MASYIKIKRSETAGNPGVLGAGEFAYSSLAGTISNGGDRLYLGTGTETNGDAVNHTVVGGKYFTDLLLVTPGTLTPNKAIIVDSSSKISQLNVANVTISGNTISSTDNNGNLILAANGTGKISINGVYTIPSTIGAVEYVLKSDGTNVVWSPSPGAAYATGINTFLNTPSSANFAAAVTDETGTGYLVFNTSPTFNTSILANTTSFDLLNTTVTTLNIGGVATNLTLGAVSGTTTVRNSLTVTGSIGVGGNIIPAVNVAYDLGSSARRFKDLWLSGTTINLGTETISVSSSGGIAISAINATPIGALIASTGAFTTVTTSSNVIIGGNLTVNGTTTTINSVTIAVNDRNLELGSVTSPTDSTADGAGITVKGLADKTLNWYLSTGAWTSSENFNLLVSKSYYINNNNVLSASTLGGTVVNSSLTGVGAITSGTWEASGITVAYGGTGLSSITSRGIMYGNASGAVGVTAASAIDGSFLKSDSTGNPYFSNVIDGGTY